MRSDSNNVLAILAALGGISAFGVAIVAVIRAILKQVVATESNTSATKANTEAIDNLKGEMGEVKNTVNIQAERISGQGKEIADLRMAIYNGRHPSH